jgi:2-oxoacid:acceptor oxidoreductase gamma subunit (pyruvate/2-ketoisovalerate family)
MLEIRIHGRGGQGGVIASKVLAEALFREGWDVQAFPAFGVERRGAPVAAFVRADLKPIRLRCQVERPDALIILDPTLLDDPATLTGLAPEGWVVVNTDLDPAFLPIPLAFRVAAVDASGIALRHGLGSASAPIVNTAILGAFARATGSVSLPALRAAIAAAVPAKAAQNAAAAAEAFTRTRTGRARGRMPALPVGPRSVPKPDLHPGGQAVSVRSMAFNRTGLWRNVSPIHREGIAPCTAACPIGAASPRVWQRLAAGEMDEALTLLLEVNPLPGITGRVCPQFCEGACHRTALDAAVAIRDLERFLADHGNAVPQPGPPRGTRGEVAIIGAGPAGLSCAYHLRRLGYAPTIFDAASDAGGVLRSGIPTYRLPRAVLDREVARVEAAGVRFKLGARLGKEFLWDDLSGYAAVFLATGAGHERHIELRGVPPDTLQSGLALLAALNGGGPVAVGERLAVIGGGNTAMDVARSARRLGSRVTVIYRRSRAEMPAFADEVAEAEAEGVQFRFLEVPVAAERVGGSLRLMCQVMRLGSPDPSGRPRPEPVPGALTTLEVDGVAAAVGEDVNPAVLPRAFPPGTLWDASGHPPVFLGGDLAGSRRTVADAIGSGRMGATWIDRWLTLHEPPVAPLPISPVPLTAMRLPWFEAAPRVRRTERDAASRLGDFREVAEGLASQAVVAEARRCLSCGACTQCDRCWLACPDVAVVVEGTEYRVDLEHCKGCLLCVAECPRGAIAVEEVASRGFVPAPGP